MFFRDPNNQQQVQFNRLIDSIRIQGRSPELRTNATALARFAFSEPSLEDLRNTLSAIQINDHLNFAVEQQWKDFFACFIHHPNAQKDRLLQTFASLIELEDQRNYEYYIIPLTDILLGLAEEDRIEPRIQQEVSQLIDLFVEKDGLALLETLLTQEVDFEPTTYLNSILKCIGKENKAEWYHRLIDNPQFKKLPLQNLIAFYKRAKSEPVLNSIIEKSPVFPEIDKTLKHEVTVKKQLRGLALLFIALIIIIGIVALKLSIW